MLAGEGSLVAVGVQPDRITDPELLLSALEQELGLDPAYVRRQYEAPGVQGHWFVPLVNLREEDYRRVDPIYGPYRASSLDGWKPGPIHWQKQPATSPVI